MRKKNLPSKKGFTLVEMIVSIGLFTIVLFVASSAFLAVLNADRKSRATRTAIDNLNLSLEDMSRRIKTGTTYNCGGGAGVNDCASPGGTVLAITDQDDQRVIYKRGVGTGAITSGNGASGCGPTFSSSTQGCLIRHITSGTPLLVTGKDVNITNLRFVVNGTASLPNTVQPYVVLLIDGITTAGKITSTFKLQTTITQRMYDL